MAGLAASLLLSPAYAGSYVLSCTGGIATHDGPTVPFSTAYALTSSDTYGGGGGRISSPNCKGAITATLTWQPASGQTAQTDPPPPSGSVIVMETCSAGASASVPPGQTCSAQCDDGLGSTQSASGSPVYDSSTPPQVTKLSASVLAKDVRYTVQGGATITLNISPSASATASTTNGPAGWSTGANVYYTVDAYPVTLSLGGTTPDASGNPNILVGQGCVGTVNGLPSGGGWSTPTFQWNVSGTTFQQWSPTTPQIGTAPANSQASYENDGPIPAVNPTGWYWNDPSNKSETVKCTVTITPPAGQGSLLTLNVAAPQQVSVQVPGFTFTATPGYIQINTKAPNQGGALDLYAGGLSGGSAGVVWTATCTTPSLFGKGSVELIQIATPNLSYTSYTGSMVPGAQHNDPQNGKTGLDGQCPYPGSSYTEGGQTPFTSNDSPTAPLSNTIGSITMTHQFTDYLMYIPPGSSQVVPLATLTWGLNMKGSAIIPSTGNWADYAKQNGSDSAGTVTTTSSQATNKFPKWTLINGPQPINSF